jgi:hypothetical protein
MMALAAAFLSPIRTSAQTPPARDSLLPVVRARLAHCDSTQTGATFITTAHERKLDGDGNVENETVYRARVYTRDEQEREILLAMWEDGVPVEEKTLRKEQEKREKDRRKRAENARAKKGDSEEKQSSRVMEPFLLENESKYQFPAILADTMAGVNTWRVTVEPHEESEDYVRGFAWVAQDDCRPIAERYEPARMPSRIQALQVEIDYTAIDGCPMPERFRITGSGKALIFIKFNFQAEIHFDSVSINPDLPDSLFSLPED